MLELLDCRDEGGCLRTAGADGISCAECTGGPVHAVWITAGGVGLDVPRYSIDPLDEQAYLGDEWPPELEPRGCCH